MLVFGPEMTSVGGTSATAVLGWALSLPGTLSVALLLTESCSVAAPSLFALTTMLPLTAAPAATVPRWTVTVWPDWLKLAPPKPLTDWRETMAGSTSVRSTFWASLGPLLVTLML